MKLTSEEMLEGYLEACAARGLARATLHLRRSYVGHFIRWLASRDLRTVAPEHMRAYSIEIAAYRYRRSKAEDAPWRPLARHTQVQRLLNVIDFLEWLVSRRLIFTNPASSLYPRTPQRRLPARIPTESEMVRLLAVPHPRSSIGRRDRAILELMYSTGLRLSEVAALDVHDLDLTSGTVTVRRGKGGRGRVVPLGEMAVAAFNDYLQYARPGFLMKPGSTALFLACDQSSSAGNRLTKFALRDLIRRLARKAELNRTINPHQIRHACATHMLRAGADIRHIQQLLGHARIDTTEIYTQVEVSDLEDVLARSHPRYRTPQQRSE